MSCYDLGAPQRAYDNRTPADSDDLELPQCDYCERAVEHILSAGRLWNNFRPKDSEARDQLEQARALIDKALATPLEPRAQVRINSWWGSE